MAPDERKPQEGSSLRDALMGKVEGSEGSTPPQAAPPSGDAADSPLKEAISIGGPSYLDRAVFCRQLATLIEVGIPILRALQMLSKRTPNAKLRAAIESAAASVEAGQPVYQAMAENQNVFSALVVNIVRIGETGGILQDSLNRLADIMESKAKIRRQIRSASMYPFVALLVAIFVVGVIMIKAIPVFKEVYAQANALDELPGVTQLLIGISDFLAAAWWLVIIVVIGVIVGAKLWARTPAGNWFFSWLCLKVPVIRGINQKIAVARSARTLSGLVTAGIPLTDAVAISSDTQENALVAAALREVHGKIEQGERMTDPLARAGVFPPLVVDMIAIGEETGTLDRMLIKVADIYDGEVDATLDGLSSILEPILIVVMGGIVFFIALAVLLPYFNLASVV
jgi:type IV pilus assembly protein PilC